MTLASATDDDDDDDDYDDEKKKEFVRRFSSTLFSSLTRSFRFGRERMPPVIFALNRSNREVAVELKLACRFRTELGVEIYFNEVAASYWNFVYLFF